MEDIENKLVPTKAPNKTEYDVLEYLLIHGEGNRWEIKKTVKRAYSGVYKAIDSLMSQDIIKETSSFASQRNRGIETVYYTLSDEGLHMCLTTQFTWNNIDKVAANYSDRLKLFKLWPKLEEAGLKEDVKDELRSNTAVSMMMYMVDVPNSLGVVHRPDWANETDLTVFHILLEAYHNSGSTKKFNALLNTIKNELELWNNLRTMINEMREAEQRHVATLESILKTFLNEKRVETISPIF